MEMTTAKTVAVFAIIVGCFAVLYPKIFHPMVLHIMGMSPTPRTNDDIVSKMPPHLRPGPGATGKRVSSHDDVPSHMRPNAHPGMRAAAEMKKATAQQSQGGGGKGMMGVILPMYAVGIVIYLVYTLSKVFGRKDNASESSSTGKDYLSNHFTDMRPGGNVGKSAGGGNSSTLSEQRRAMLKQKELEKLLMKAENEDINDNEMSELKRRLLETEAQMSRILQAMEVVQQKVGGVAADLTGDDGIDNVADADLAPNMEDTAAVAETEEEPTTLDDGDEETDELMDDGELEDGVEMDEGASSSDLEENIDNAIERLSYNTARQNVNLSGVAAIRNLSSLADELKNTEKVNNGGGDEVELDGGNGEDETLVNGLRHRLRIQDDQ